MAFQTVFRPNKLYFLYTLPVCTFEPPRPRAQAHPTYVNTVNVYAGYRFPTTVNVFTVATAKMSADNIILYQTVPVELYAFAKILI